MHFHSVTTDSPFDGIEGHRDRTRYSAAGNARPIEPDLTARSRREIAFLTPTAREQRNVTGEACDDGNPLPSTIDRSLLEAL